MSKEILRERFEEWWEVEMESYYMEEPYGKVLSIKLHLHTAWMNGAYVAKEYHNSKALEEKRNG